MVAMLKDVQINVIGATVTTMKTEALLENLIVSLIKIKSRTRR